MQNAGNGGLLAELTYISTCTQGEFTDIAAEMKTEGLTLASFTTFGSMLGRSESECAEVWDGATGDGRCRGTIARVSRSQRPVERDVVLSHVDRRRAAMQGEIRECINVLIGNAAGFDTFKNVPMIQKALPWDSHAAGREWQDADSSELFELVQRELSNAYNMTCGHGTMFKGALISHFQRNKFDSLRTRLASLPRWDGQGRVGNYLHALLGAEEGGYTSAVGELIVRAGVRRAYSPGEKFDYLPVLVGPQGTYKSSTCRALALCPEFFADGIPALSDPNLPRYLQGRWIIELGELAALRAKGTHAQAIKQFITRTAETYTPKYMEFTRTCPRRFILIGTTNEPTFWEDDTGGRRYLPVNCPGIGYRIELDFINDYAEQLWAEGLHLWRDDHTPLVMPDDVASLTRAAQESARVCDPYLEPVAEYLAEHDHGFVIDSQTIVREALDIATNAPGFLAASKRVAEIMNSGTFPGWEASGRQRVSGRKNPSRNTWTKVAGTP